MRNSQSSFNDQTSINLRSNDFSQRLNERQQNSRSESNEDSIYRSQSQMSILKSQQSIAQSSNQIQNLDTSKSNISAKSQTTIPIKARTKTQFQIASHSVYKKFEEPAKMNFATNFIPQTNHISSTELLMNSGIYNKGSNPNDSTKASILINQNQSIIDPSFNDSVMVQKTLKSQLDIIDEELNLEREKMELQKHQFDKEQFQDQFKGRRASEILIDSIKQLEEERRKPQPKQIHIAFSPYNITRQDVLVKNIENQKKQKDYEYQRDNAEQNQIKTKHANELLEYLGLKERTDESEEEEEDDKNNPTSEYNQKSRMILQPQLYSRQPSSNKLSEDNSDHASVAQTVVSTYSRKTNRKQTNQVVDIISQMNLKTPQQQKNDMMKGKVSTTNIKSEKNFKSQTKIDFEDDQQKKSRSIKRITQPSSQVSQVSIQLESAQENQQFQSSLAQIDEQEEGRVYESTLAVQHGGEEDTYSVKQRIDQFVDRRSIKQSFRVPLRYQSNIIKRAFSKQGQTYISKWLSQSTFDQLELDLEEDIDQTVIKNAAVGQQVLLIESKQPRVKGRLNRRGKFRKRRIGTNNNFDDEDEDEEEENQEDILKTANSIDRKEVQKKRMRIKAKVESNKEKILARQGRENNIRLELPESKWEQQQVLLGKRKVRFQLENDLYQPELDVGPDTIFKNPTFFRGLKSKTTGSESLISIGQSVTSFAQIEDEPERKNIQDHDQKINLQSIFNEIYYGGDKKDSKFYQQWKEFYMYKEKFRNAFERLDGMIYKYPHKDKIEQDVRNNQAYEDMITPEEGQKQWYPEHEPQTNPPEVLKEFIIEPNILVYTNKILDLDRNYKHNHAKKEKSQVESRRQAKIGLADDNVAAHQLQLLVEGQKPNTNYVQPVLGAAEGNRQLFDFMYQHYSNLPFVPMKKIVKAVDESEKNKPKISELERMLFEQTPMVSTNIYTHQTMFRIKEVDEYENELRKKQRLLEMKLQNQEKQTSTTENKLPKERAQDQSTNKAQNQINNMVAAFNPINLQYTGDDLKSKAIMKGVESINETRLTFHNIGTINNKQITKAEIKKTAQTNNHISNVSSMRSVFDIQSLQSIQNDQEQKQQQQQQSKKQLDQQQQQQLQTYSKNLEIKTIKDLNEMYTTPESIIAKTLKSINEMKNQGKSLQNTEYNFRKSQNMSQYSMDSNPNDYKQLVKNRYEADYGSVLTNTKLDYNTPDFYHQREAEQGLFYLSKHYRDYLEPARDVFADKNGWDILDKFASNPKNVNALKPSVHNYGEQKQVYSEDDILTAFHGIQVMNNHKKLMEDVDKRNQQNFNRRIYYNQSQ